MKRIFYISVVLILLVALSACDMLPPMPGAATQDVEPAPAVDTVPMVSVTGKVVPEVWGMVPEYPLVEQLSASN